MKAYSELIIGLPGETYESFIRGVGTLFEIGQHFMFQIYPCILLPNSVLGQKAAVEKYKIKTVRTEMVHGHVPTDSACVTEYVDYIVETDSMPREEWVRCMVFYYCAAALHAHGFLRAFAVCLYAEKQVPYERFYDGILSYFSSHPELTFSKVFSELFYHVKGQSQGVNNTNFVFPPCGDIVWDDNEYFALRILERTELFYEEVSPYLKSFGLEEDLFSDLLLYQQSVLRRPGEAGRRIRLAYDVHGFLQDAYVNDMHPVRRREHTLALRDTAPLPDWKSFGKQVIWYGRLGWASYKDDVSVVPDRPGEGDRV